MHGVVIALLGAAVGILDLGLPQGPDRVSESVVGATLVGLGAVVLWQLGRDRANYPYAGRIRLIIGMTRRAWAPARRRGAGPRSHSTTSTAEPRSASVLHATGAETPTQVVLFSSTGASGSPAGAAVILPAYLTGLIPTSASPPLGSPAWSARRLPAVQIALDALTGLSSLAVSGLLIAGHAAVLPALLGG